MPGHVKLGAKGEDPDPEPYLVVSMEAKREDMMKPYDSKKSYWCPDGKGGYAECMVQKMDEKEGEVLMGHIVSLILDALNLLTLNKLSREYCSTENILNSRKRFSKPKNLDKSIHPSSKNARTWLT